MLSLEEAIKYYSELAEENEKDAEQFKRIKATQDMISHCYECAEEHRQLAEWLRELRVKRQIITNVKEQCKVWKMNDFQNRDYGTGFISAISNIEGLIAYTEEQLEVKDDDDD